MQCAVLAATPMTTTILCMTRVCGATVTAVRPMSFWRQRINSLAQKYRLEGKSPRVDLSVVGISPIDVAEEYRERYIPLNRRTLIRELLLDERLVDSAERERFEEFALGLDSAIMNRYHGILQELKQLFDPLNPDKDTLSTRQWSRRERLDSEFWLLQRMGHVMEKANFRELNRTEVEAALSERDVLEGVKVSVNPAKYDVLKFWALGRDVPHTVESRMSRLATRLLDLLPSSVRTRSSEHQPQHYYKRVVVAVRMKQDEKMLIKMFKDIPVTALEQLLPDGRISISRLDQAVLYSTLTLGTLGLALDGIAWITEYKLQWSMVLAGVAGLVGIRAWTTYKNRRNDYLLRLNQMLYYKNVANNRGLLALLTDRAEDESFKETLLAYTFLHSNRAPYHSDHAGGITASQLERRIEEWITEKAGQEATKVEFDSEEALVLLTSLSLVHRDQSGEKDLSGGTLSAVNLDAAVGHVPAAPPSLLPLLTRYREGDASEVEAFEIAAGDVPGFLAHPDVNKSTQKRLKQMGWK